MYRKIGFFQEDNGNYSSMRLMSFISLIASTVFGYLTLKMSIVHVTSNSDVGLYLTFGFLLAAFAPKAVQKFIENKVTI